MIESVLLIAMLQVPPTPVVNPTRVEFTCPDHDKDNQHELDILQPGGVVIATILLGDPPVDPDGIVRATVNVQPIAFGEYVAVVRAVAGALKSENSEPSNPFVRTPGKPSKPTVK